MPVKKMTPLGFASGKCCFLVIAFKTLTMDNYFKLQLFGNPPLLQGSQK
jgi:hypothetical protein